MGATIGTVLFAAPENALKMVKDLASTASYAVETIIDVVKCTANLLAGILIGTTEIIDYATDNCFSENSNGHIHKAMDLSGENDLCSILIDVL